MSAKEGFVASEGMVEIADEFQKSLIHVPAHHFRIFIGLQSFCQLLHVLHKETKAQRKIIYTGKTIAKLEAKPVPLISIFVFVSPYSILGLRFGQLETEIMTPL